MTEAYADPDYIYVIPPAPERHLAAVPDAPATKPLEITDDMRRMLPPGAIGRIVEAAADAPPHIKAKAELQKRLARTGMGTGWGRSPMYDSSALSMPYSHGVQR